MELEKEEEKEEIAPTVMKEAELDIMGDLYTMPMVEDVPAKANLEGEEPVNTPLEVVEEVEEAIDIVAEDDPLNGGQGEDNVTEKGARRRLARRTKGEKRCIHYFRKRQLLLQLSFRSCPT